MIRILYASPSITDTSSFYRGWGALCHLMAEHKNISLMHSAELNWANVMPADLVIFTRSCTAGCVKGIEFCKKQGKFVWLDYDDSILHIPKGNPCYEMFQKGRDHMHRAAELADLITVSTEELKKDFSNVSDKVQLIPNAHNDTLLGEIKAPKERQKIILWRGSPTHDRDLLQVADKIVNAANSKQADGWTFVFMGYDPVYISSRIIPDRVKCVAALDIIDYFNAVKAINPAILIVPLEDTPFNRCKSNISWIEATYAGALTIATDLPEFRRPGVVLTDSQFFDRDLMQTMEKYDTPGFIDAHWIPSKVFIENNLYLSGVNKQREAIIWKSIEGQMDRLSRRLTEVGGTSIPG